MRRVDLEDALDDAAFGADGGAVDGGGLAARNESYHRGDFLAGFEALEQRSRACGFEKFLFHIGGCDALLSRHAIEKSRNAFGSGGAGEDGVYRHASAGDRFR